jgi:VanZ family protein
MNERARRFAIYVLPAAVYAAAIFTISSIPRLYPPSLGLSWDDKIYHFAEYVGFTILLYRAFYYWEWSRTALRRVLLTLILGTVTAALDELHQHYTPGRVTELSDWLADFTGIIFGITVISLVLLRARRRRSEG